VAKDGDPFLECYFRSAMDENLALTRKTSTFYMRVV